MTSDNAALDRVRELLAKAEADGVTAAEAEALTAKAAELMARYGIGSVLSVIPPIIVYILFQKHLVRGITLGVGK